MHSCATTSDDRDSVNSYGMYSYYQLTLIDSDYAAGDVKVL
jgi:hypothetical protein